MDENYGYKLTRVIDINGDGIPEILQPRPVAIPGSDYVLEVYQREAVQADLLKTVTDSLGAQTSVSYAPMSDRSVYTPYPQAGCAYPYGCPTRGRWLVCRSA